MHDNTILYASIETVGLKKDYPKKSNLILENNFIFDNGTSSKNYSEVIKNTEKISIEAMSLHGITEEAKKKGIDLKKSRSFKLLHKQSTKKESNNFLIVFGLDFFIDNYENTGISFDSFNIIDLKQVFTYFLLSEETGFQEMIDFRLSLINIMYYIVGDNSVISKGKNISKNFYKAELLKYFLEYIMKKYDKTLLELVELSSGNIMLKYVYFQGKQQLFKSLEDRNLYYLSQNSPDNNVRYTASQLLKERGIELDKSLIPAGKYAGSYVENIEDIEYLEWFLNNMKHFDEKLLSSIKNRITYLKGQDVSSKKAFSIEVAIYSDRYSLIGELPSNIREWLQTQPNITVKYNHCDLLINHKNKDRQEKIYSKILNNVNVINIKQIKEENE